jgi:hypothetical protein
MDFNKRASNVPRGCGERITRMERPQQLLCSFRSCMSSCRGAVGRVTDESMFEVHVREHGQALIHLREADVRLLRGHLRPARPMACSAVRALAARSSLSCVPPSVTAEPSSPTV